MNRAVPSSSAALLALSTFGAPCSGPRRWQQQMAAAAPAAPSQGRAGRPGCPCYTCRARGCCRARGQASSRSSAPTTRASRRKQYRQPTRYGTTCRRYCIGNVVLLGTALLPAAAPLCAAVLAALPRAFPRSAPSGFLLLHGVCFALPSALQPQCMLPRAPPSCPTLPGMSKA